MLKNLILDMGNVMIHFSPELFIRRLEVSDPKIREQLLQEVFHSVEWSRMDWGQLDEAAAWESVCRRLPQSLHEMARELIFRWDQPIVPVAGMEALVQECKAAGMGVYLLSNASTRLPEYWPRVPGSSLFDGVVVSGALGVVKPMPEIYLHALKQFDLRAEECLFVDDVPMNVVGAAAVGIHGFLFRDDPDKLREEILALGGKL